MLAVPSLCEQGFSALRRVKTYLRSTMKQGRFNHLMILHIYKDLTDSLDLIQVANDFVFVSEHRSTLFGRLLCSDRQVR